MMSMDSNDSPKAKVATRNLDERTITAAVVERFSHASEERFQQIMQSLVRHLHDFARDVSLTEEEWVQGVGFLTATGHACSDTRQEFILLSDTLGLSQLVVAQTHKRSPSASEQTVLGPFYVDGPPRLARFGNIAKGLKGPPCFINAHFMSVDGQPVSNAVVDVWQADSKGYYDVQDPHWSPDEMRLRGRFNTDDNGSIQFCTVMPSAYPIPTDGPVGSMLEAAQRHPMRPAHIHFMVDAPGYERLITHVFVAEDEYLDSDAVFAVRSSCIGDFVRHDQGESAPNGELMRERFYTLDHQFVLEPV